MQSTTTRHRWTFFVLCVTVIFLATGWGFREWAHAAAQNKLVPSKTINLSDIKIDEFIFKGKPRGKIGIYMAGDTAGTKKFVVGQFRLRPGLEPHPIHKHAEEEVLIVTRGKGEIICAGKTTKVAAGSIMYTGPNAPHGMRNTGEDELEFYFVKWMARK